MTNPLVNIRLDDLDAQHAAMPHEVLVKEATRLRVRLDGINDIATIARAVAPTDSARRMFDAIEDLSDVDAQQADGLWS